MCGMRISHGKADFVALGRLPDAGRRADRELDAVQVANLQEPIWTSVILARGCTSVGFSEVHSELGSPAPLVSDALRARRRASAVRSVPSSSGGLSVC